MKITDINWETDGETVDLPTEVEIPDNTPNTADYLSDKYGWLVNSFSLPTDKKKKHKVIWEESKSVIVEARNTKKKP